MAKENSHRSFELPEGYKTGVELFDRQHQDIFSRLSLIAEDAEKPLEKKELLSHIRFLIDYADTHLADEEKMMEEYQYPYLEAHRAEHDRFRRQSKEFLDAYENGQSPIPRILEFIYDWFVHHILETDMKYSGFFKTGSDAL